MLSPSKFEERDASPQRNFVHSMNPRFHYTKALRLSSICADRLIKPATLYVPANEKPAVWCSTRLDFEPTARPGNPSVEGFPAYSFEEMTAEASLNPVRIEVDPAACPYTWGAFIKLSGVKKKMARALVQHARAQGSRPEDWYVSFEPIGIEYWKTIAYYFEQSWREITVNDQVVEELSRLSVDELRSVVEAGIFRLAEAVIG